MFHRIDAEQRKEHIANNAAKVFRQKGFQAASLQDVAEKSKLSKAGVFHYFKSKDDILAYILINYADDFIQKLTASIEESRKKGLPPQEAFKKLIGTYARLLSRDRDRRLIVLRERHQLSEKNKAELLKRERAIFRIMKDQLSEICSLKKGLDRSAITFMCIGMSHWLGYWYKEGKSLDLEDIIDQNVRIIFGGILN